MTQVTFPTLTDDIGDYQSGSILDAAFFTTIKTGIDAVVHSTNNPTVTPEDIIDEVVTARGSKASLDARLDVEHNEDGTHNLAATVVTTDVLDDTLIDANRVINGKFDDWTGGGSAAPDSWALTGAGAAVARTGVGMADTTRKIGQFAAKLTYGAATVKLTQEVVAAASWNSYDYVEGDIISLTLWIFSSTVNKCRASINDGNTESFSSYHTGDGTWQRLQINHTVSAAATKLDVVLHMEGTGDGVYSGICLIFSRTATDRYIDNAVDLVESNLSALSSPQYVTLATAAGLSAERVLTMGAGLELTDAGAGSTVTVSKKLDRTRLFYEEDFLGAASLLFEIEGSTVTYTIGEATALEDHPGYITLDTAATMNNQKRMVSAAFMSELFDELVFVLRHRTAITNIRVCVGMHAPGSEATIDNTVQGIYFHFTPASNASWMAVTRDGSGITETDTAVDVTVDVWYELRIVRSGANVLFYINGNLVATHSANVLNDNTTALVVGHRMITLTASDKTVEIDYIGFKSTAIPNRY